MLYSCACLLLFVVLVIAIRCVVAPWLGKRMHNVGALQQYAHAHTDPVKVALLIAGMR